MAVTMTYSASHVLYAVPVTFKGAWMWADRAGRRERPVGTGVLLTA